MRNYKDWRAANEHMGKRSVSIHEAKRAATNMGPREQLQTWGQESSFKHGAKRAASNMGPREQLQTWGQENRQQTKGKESGQQSIRPRK
jgi:hypothetical protein